MGFDDLFKHREHGHRDNRGYYGGHQNGHHSHHGGIQQYLYLFEKLKNNKKLLIALSVIALIMVIIAIAVIIMLIPLLMKFLDIIQKNGISGIIETARPLLELLWSGKGK